MAALRRSKKAMKEGWIINRELRKGYPADFAIGEPMPDVEGLPILSETDGNAVTTGNTHHVTDFSFKNRVCNAVTPLTDGNTSPLSTKPDQPASEDPWDEFLRDIESKSHG
jgi:hypothetical protein